MPGGGDADKLIISQHAASITTPQQLLNRIHCCRAATAFQPDTLKLTFSVSPGLQATLEALIRIIAVTGGSLKLGAPPRSVHERALSKMLVNMGEWKENESFCISTSSANPV
ncbi:unnamed protein product [Polarella glacialis]|uniref:Uncharacterized protein n=1 Tax=Polarella glacialis TaxID=89957 RepID=A0A813DRW8_POLGL|nr:unnamed protein product [Polarella glacialis]